MTVFSKFCAGFSALAVTSGFHIAPSVPSSGLKTNLNLKNAGTNLNLHKKNTADAVHKKNTVKREDGDDTKSWSGADYASDSEEEFPADDAAEPAASEPLIPPLTESGPLVEHWDVHDLSCAYGLFTHACPSTHFCYKNFAAVEPEPPECEEKRMPHTACGVFDERFWGVACGPESKPDGGVQLFSCQKINAGGEEAEEPAEEPVADEADLFMGSKEGMCLPCCDRDAYPDEKDADKECGSGDARFPDCPFNYEHAGVDMKLVEHSTEICVQGKAGDTLHGCPSGPVELEAEVDVCATIEDFAKETKNPELKPVLEQPIPAHLEAELHEQLEKMALKKADVCKPPPKPKAKAKPPAKAEPKPAAKPGPKAEPKAEPKPAPKAGPNDGAAGALTDKMNRAPTANEPIPDTTAPTAADQAAADSEALAAEFLLKQKEKKSSGSKVPEKVTKVPRSASEIKQQWSQKAVKTVSATDNKHAEHVEAAKKAVEKVRDIVKPAKSVAAKVVETKKIAPAPVATKK